MKDNNCIFCKIANGEIPAAALYEDDMLKVILDRGPASKGHALVIPKNHFADLYELDDETASNVLKTAKHMAVKMREAFKCDGFNLLQNNGEVAGQTVFHFHMHLIPRYENDNVKLSWKPGDITDEELKELADKIK